MASYRKIMRKKLALKAFFISFAKTTYLLFIQKKKRMNTLKNFAFGMCLCGTFGLGWACGVLVSSSGGKTETVMSDSVDAEQGNVVVEAIMSRRSIRKYKDQPVEREKLETIVNCGINAPSGMNRQPWQVRVVDNADYINGITEVFKKANPKAAEEPGSRICFGMLRP